MSNVIRYFFFLSILLTCEDIQAQRLGSLPSKTRWQQLCHDSLRIIYPEGNEHTARRVASLMLKFAAVDPIAKESRYKPIDIILQPQTNIANGNVGLAPYVSELFLQPNENPFELGSLPWTDLLAIHEYRHVQQVNAVNTGISHFVKVVLGELAFSGMYGLATSNWLREGDAVYAETKWSPQGRGRLSRFLLPFRERTKEEEPWGYYKLRNGSYKQYYPDHYPLGYMMVQYGNHVFGEATWDTIFRQTPRMKPIYDPLSGVVKRYYGKSNRNLYLDAVKFYGDQWKARNVPDIRYPTIPLSEKNMKDAFFDMSYPDVAGDGSIYCSITTFDSTAAIYKIKPDGHRERIVVVGQQLDACFDYSCNRLVWTELRSDPRWLRKDENVIVVYDEGSHKKMDIHPSKGYFMPSLDLSAQNIAALHTDPEGNHSLHILDAATGELIKELPNEKNLYLSYPTFSEDGLELVATARNAEGRMCLIRQQISTGEISQITHYSYAVLGKPIQAGPWIFLTCGIGDQDQVYAVDKAEGIFYLVTAGNSAHYDPAWDPVHDEIITTEYTNAGKKLVRAPGVPRQWKMVNLDDGIKYVPGAEERNLLDEPPAIDTTFAVKKYSPWSNALNIHSWLVSASDPIVGIEFRSDDIMNNVSIAAGYEYNLNNNVYGPYIDAKFGMWFPELNLGYSKLNKNETSTDGLKFRSVNEETYAGIALPFTFNPGVYRQVVRLSTIGTVGILRSSPKQEGTDNVPYNYINYRLLVINSRRRAYRQALPSWGQRFEISYSSSVSGYNVSQMYTNLQLALPSFKPTHYLALIGEVLTQDLKESIQLSSNYGGARGFNLQDAEENYRFGVTYGFPVLYPDIGLGNILYMRRIRLQPFYDIAYTSDPESISPTLESAGAELLIDFQFGNVTLGLRFVRLLSGYKGDPFRFEVFIPPYQF